MFSTGTEYVICSEEGRGCKEGALVSYKGHSGHKNVICRIIYSCIYMVMIYLYIIQYIVCKVKYIGLLCNNTLP